MTKDLGKGMSDIGAFFAKATKNQIDQDTKSAERARQGASRRYNALLAFYKKIAKLEEDAAERRRKLNEKDSEKYTASLQKRIKSLQKTFAEGYKLLKKDSKRRIALRKREMALIQQERDLSLLQAAKDMKKYLETVNDKYDETFSTDFEKLLKKQEGETKEFKTKVSQQISVTMVGSSARKDFDALLANMEGRSKDFVKRSKKRSVFDASDLVSGFVKREQEIFSLRSQLIAAQSMGNQEEVESFEKSIAEKDKLRDKDIEKLKIYLAALKDAKRNKVEIQLPDEDLFTTKIKTRDRTALIKSIQVLFNDIEIANEAGNDALLKASTEAEKKRTHFQNEKQKLDAVHAKQQRDFREKTLKAAIKDAENALKQELGIDSTRFKNEEEATAKLLSLQKQGIITREEYAKLLGLYFSKEIIAQQNFGDQLNGIRGIQLNDQEKLILKSLEFRKKANAATREEDKSQLREAAQYYSDLAALQKRHQDEIEGIIGRAIEDPKGKGIEDLRKQQKALVDLMDQLKNQTEEPVDMGLFAELKSEYNLTTQAINQTTLALKRQKIEIDELDVPKILDESKWDKFLVFIKDAAEQASKFFGPVIWAISKIIELLQKAADALGKFLDYATGGNLNLNVFDLITSAANALIEKLDEFKEKQKELDEQFKAARISGAEYKTSSELLAKEKANAREVAKETVDQMIDDSIRFIDALVEVAPHVMQRLIDQMPKLLAALERFIPQFFRILEQFLPVLVPVMVRFWVQVASLVRKEIGKMFRQMVQNLINRLHEFRKSLNPFRRRAGKAQEGSNQGYRPKLFGIFGDTPHPVRVRSQDGLLARFSPGDTVIAAKEPAELMRQALQAVGSEVKMATRRPPPSVSSAKEKFSGGGQKIDIAVIAEGRVLDAVQMQALERGHAPKIAKRLRKASGVKVGFNRGRYNKFAVNEN